MNPTLPAFSIMLFVLLFSFPSLAQETSYYQVYIETQPFSPEQLRALDEQLANKHDFKILAACRDEGFILIGFPTHLRLRVPEAEAIIIEAIADEWEQQATINHELTRENIFDCAEAE